MQSLRIWLKWAQTVPGDLHAIWHLGSESCSTPNATTLVHLWWGPGSRGLAGSFWGRLGLPWPRVIAACLSLWPDTIGGSIASGWSPTKQTAEALLHWARYEEVLLGSFSVLISQRNRGGSHRARTGCKHLTGKLLAQLSHVRKEWQHDNKLQTELTSTVRPHTFGPLTPGFFLPQFKHQPPPS